MVDATTLLIFLLAVLTLFLSPGPNMAFVLSHGMAHGQRGGVAAALGITAADLVLTVCAATGLTATLAAWPPMFDVLRYAGAVYLLYLAAQALRKPLQALNLQARPLPMAGIAGRAMLNSLLNPKALLFFMLFLPQFVDPARGPVVPQLLVLGGVLSTAALVFNTLLGCFSGRIGAFLQRHPRAARHQGRCLAAVMGLLALRLVLMERPAA